MIGGVTVNLILGFLIYIMILNIWGDAYISNDKITYGAHLATLAMRSMDLKKEI